jgi:hypothetical protein
MYRITVGDYIYVGSTKDFRQRKNSHKFDYTTKELKVYQMIREAGGWDKCEMTPIEEYECEGQLQARMREEYWRREYNANMNTLRAYVTEEERIEQKKECNKKWSKQNYKENKETINTVQNGIYICECGIQNTIRNKARHERTKKHLDYLATDNHLPLI